MVKNDLDYIRRLVAAGLIQSPCLEAGAGLDDHSSRSVLAQHGIEWFGTDLRTSSKEVFAIDLCDEFEKVDAAIGGRRFKTVLVFNVIEHVFEPLKVLDNAIRLLEPGGHCVVVVPTVWPLHYYPYDCWRANPNLFEVYAEKRNLELLPEHFCYVSPEIRPIDRDAKGNATLPAPSRTSWRSWKSRIVHRLFDTYGRGMTHAQHVTTGAVLRA